MPVIEIPYGASVRTVSVPDDWLGAIVAPQPVAAHPDVNGCIADAIRQPIGAPRLRDLVHSGQTVALIVDDRTRKTPVHRLLPAVLAELHTAGIQRSAICIVIALGTHRPLSSVELSLKLGAAALGGYTLINVASSEAGAFVECGAASFVVPPSTSSPVPIAVNRWVVEADVRIGIGMITPHLDAGFSGGAKIVLPGVCSVRTVDAFHRASAFVTENQLGQPNPPLRRLLEAFVQEHIPLHYIVNTILTLDGALFACVAGGVVAAHRAGVTHAQSVYGVPVARRFPVVVAGCSPYDQDLWQTIKGAWAGDLITADGGTLILVTAAPEGSSNYARVPFYAGRTPSELRKAISSNRVDDAMQAATGLLWSTLRQRVNLIIVSDGLSPHEVERMGAHWRHSVEAAVEGALAALPSDQRHGAVAVIPQAGVVLPMLAPAEVG